MLCSKWLNMKALIRAQKETYASKIGETGDIFFVC